MTSVLDNEPPAAEAGEGDSFRVVGTVLNDKYRVDRFLGEGGMGTVYAGTHTRLGTKHAIKFLKLYGLKDKQTFLQRFLREAQIGAQLKHPGIVQVQDLETFTDGVTPFLVMELLDGQSFGERLKSAGKVSWQEAFDVVRRASDPLAAAHSRGVVHRDLKPDNLFVCRDGELKVLDFGIARFGDIARLTRTGTIIGTPYYMSREQVSCAKDIDARTDVYSLGVVLYHAIAGRPIFDASNQMELIALMAGSVPADIRRHVPSLPEHVAAVIRKAMAPDRVGRFSSMGELSAAIDSSLRAGDGHLVALPTDKTMEAVADFRTAPTRSEGEAVPQLIPDEASAPSNPANLAPVRSAPPVLADAGSSRNAPKQPGRFAGVAVGVGLSVVLAIGFGLWLVWGRAKPVAAPVPQPVAVQAAPAQPAPPARRWVRVVSEPAGAKVERDGRALGSTPVTVEGSDDRTVMVRLSLEGFAARDVEVLPSPEGGTAEFRLTPIAKPASPPAPAPVQRKRKKTQPVDENAFANPFGD